MKIRYTAFGLELCSAFALSGMRPAAASSGLPVLALELIAPTELERLWSGSDDPPIWRGLLGDGLELTIEQGAAGDLLFTYGDHACFRLDSGKLSLACAPQRAGLDWQRALLSKVLASVSVMRGYEALHASAVTSPQGVVAVLAPSGMGKTTLAIELLRRGWPLFADDVLAFTDGPAGVLAYPGTPHMNIAAQPTDVLTMAAGEAEGLGYYYATLGMLAGERWVAVANTAVEACAVRLVCLLERAPGLPLDAQILPVNPLPLAPYMLGLPGDAERERRGFALYADLVGSATLMRLTCDVADRPADLADLIERAVAAPRPELAVGSVG